MTPKAASKSVAVILPCYNEELTIEKVVKDFKKALPEAQIFVYDNNSTDNTAEIARKAGALVFEEQRQGKGHVVRRMFADIDADIYVMADGDDTYLASDAPKLIAPIMNGYDMAVGRRANVTQDAGRRGHGFGNWVFNRLFRAMFQDAFSDIFSGYRAFSRRFVKSFPALSTGFEIESELSVHALSVLAPFKEIEVEYGVRPDGSESKLSTFGDGFRILSILVLLLKEVRPMRFFGWLSVVSAFASAVMGLPVVFEYFDTGTVSLLPRWILSVGLMVLALLLLACGLILDSVARGRLETKRLAYLAAGER